MSYKAFLSYSHAADNRLAPALQGALHGFSRPFYRQWAVRIFRDKSTLQLTPELWTAIREAIRNSEFFILLASPDAARSPWVQDEIAEWLRLHNGLAENLLIVLTGGEIVWNKATDDFDWAKTDALPPNLKNCFAGGPPYWEDLRWVRTEANLSQREPRFQDAVATLAAALHRRAKDEIVGEDVKQYRRFQTFRAGVVITLVVLTLMAFWQAFEAQRAARRERTAREEAESASQRERFARQNEAQQRQYAEQAAIRERQARTVAEDRRREAERQRQIALARGLVARAEQMRGEPLLLERSVLLATEALKRFHSLGMMSLEADEALRRGLTLLPGRLGRIETGLPASDSSQIAWSRDRSRILIAAPSGLEVWSRDGPRRLFRIESPQLGVVALSPNGDVFARAPVRDARTFVEILSTATRGTVGRFDLEGVIHDLAVSPGGACVATAGSKGWNLWLGAKTGAAMSFPDARSLVFSPDGRHFVTREGSGTDRLWSFEPDGQPPAVRKVKDFESGFLGFSADGRFFLSREAGGLLLENVENEETLESPWDEEVTLDPDLTALSAGGRYLAASDVLGNLDVWDVATGSRVSSVGNEDPSSAVVFSPEGDQMAVATGRGQVDLWEIGLDEGLPRITRGHVVAAAFDASETHHFVAELSQRFDPLARGTPVATLWRKDVEGREKPVLIGDVPVWQEMAASADGRVAAAAGGLGLTLWNMESGRRIGVIGVPEELEEVDALALSPDGQFLAAGFAGLVRVWRVSNRRTERSFSLPGRPLRLAVSPDGLSVTILATAELNNARWPGHRAPIDPDEKLLWVRGDVRRGGLAESYTLGTYEKLEPFTLSPDGRYLATSEDQIVVRELPGGRVVARLFYDSVSALGFDRQGRHLGIADGRQIRVIELASGRELASIQQRGGVAALSFSPGGRYLSAVDGISEVQVSHLRPEDLIAAACARVETSLSREEWEHYLGRDEPLRETCPNQAP